MKYFVIFLVLIGFTGLIGMSLAFASESLFYGTSSFEKLPSALTRDSSKEIEIKFQYTDGSYSLNELKPIVDVTPIESASFVHVEFEPVEGLYRNSIARIHGTITVDSGISTEKVFLNISYVGTDSNGILFRSGWNDSAIIDVRENLAGGSLDKTVYPVPWEHKSPLKQIRHGIYGNDIVCSEDRVLVLKKSSELYSCITPETVPKLFARGWALNEVKIIDVNTAEQGKPLKIAGIIDRLNTPEGFEYHLIPLREELPRIEYTGYATLNLFSTEQTVHNFLRNLEGSLVEVEGKFLLDDGEYFRHFSGFPTIPVEKMKVISDNENLEYFISGAKVLSIIKIPDNAILYIVIQESQKGSLEITIPRDLFDVKIGEHDDDFIVLIDGKEIDFDETKNDKERKMVIPFEENATTIQVIGTFPI